MSIFENKQVSDAFGALNQLAASSGATERNIREFLGDEGFAGSQAEDAAQISAAIARLQSVFKDVAAHITPDDLKLAVRKVTELVDFQGREQTGGRVVQKDWSQYLIAFEAMAQARPDLYKWTGFERSLSGVAALGEDARVVRESAVFVNSGVEVADPRPQAVRNALKRLELNADA